MATDAMFESICPICDDNIEVGDSITHCDDGWCHEGCV